MSENQELVPLVSDKPSKLFKHPRIAHNGFLYHFHKKCKRHLRWKCNRVFAMKCPCVLRTSMDIQDLRIIAIDHEHVHRNDDTSIAILKLKLSNPIDGNREQNALLELTENDFLNTKNEKRNHESEDKNNKKLKCTTNEEFIIIPSQDNGKDLKSTDVNPINNNNKITEQINIHNEVVETSRVNFKADQISNESDELEIEDDSTRSSKYVNIKTYSKIHKQIHHPTVEETIVQNNDPPLCSKINENTLEVSKDSIDDIELTLGNFIEKEMDSKSEVNSNKSSSDDENSSYDDHEEALMLTKENWPDVMYHLNDPSEGFKMFESILIKKIISHMMFSGVIAENQLKLDHYKNREHMWRSKFLKLGRKMRRVKDDVRSSACNSPTNSLELTKNVSVQTDIGDYQIEQLVNENPCQEEILSNEKHLTINVTEHKEIESNDESTSINLNENTLPDIEISQNENSIQISNVESLQHSILSTMLQKSPNIPSKENANRKKSMLNSSIVPAQIKHILPETSQNIEQNNTIDLTDVSDSETDFNNLDLEPNQLTLPILEPNNDSAEVTSSNIFQTNINNLLPIPKIEIKLNEKVNLSVMLSLTQSRLNNIECYELYCYSMIKNDSIHNPWKLIGEFSYIPFPMVVTLKLDDIDRRIYYFSARTKDKLGKYGSFSEPISTKQYII